LKVNSETLLKSLYGQRLPRCGRTGLIGIVDATLFNGECDYAFLERILPTTAVITRATSGQAGSWIDDPETERYSTYKAQARRSQIRLGCTNHGAGAESVGGPVYLRTGYILSRFMKNCSLGTGRKSALNKGA
jgi:hypothetical protein